MEITKTNVQPHIRCANEDKADYAILPGDPKRVDHVKTYLSEVCEIAYNREYKSISGYYKGIKVLVVSTGIGGASTGIAVEELHNIGVQNMIRIGSCGALQQEIQIGDLVIANGAVRDDGASKAYIKDNYPAVPDTKLLTSILNVADELSYSYHVGRVRSHDSFYTDEEEQIDKFWASKGILACDMETAALFVIGGLRGVRTASILNTVASYQGDLEQEINSYVDGETSMQQGETREIIAALEVIVALERKKDSRK